MHRPIIIGTRDSKMAIKMANYVAAQLKEQYSDIQIEVKAFKSDGCLHKGDLRLIGGKGAFTRNLDEKLQHGEIDCAVHCLKDIPGDVPGPEGTKILAMLERKDPRDSLIMREGMTKVEPHHVLATSSPRRRAFLKHMYPENKIIPLRGNADTRLRKLMDEQFDAMVLSYCGLQWLGLESHATKVFSPDEFLPSVGQGSLCLRVREEDIKVCKYLRSLNNTQSEMTAAAEREMLWILKGDCHSAIAGYCTFENEQLHMRGIVASPDGSEFVEASASQSVSEAPKDLGKLIAEELIKKGAKKYLGACARLPLYS